MQGFMQGFLKIIVDKLVVETDVIIENSESIINQISYCREFLKI